MRLLSWSGLLLSLGMLLGCYPKGDPSQPIPSSLAPAPQKAQRLVVVLPGRADDVEALRDSGMVEAIQTAWPDADVVLAGLALGYYMQGRAAERLHEEIIAPARQRGYREVWLAGASMGGMGALMYDRAYPGDADGIVLLAPYLGEKPLLQEIADTGGIAQWTPGPVPDVVDADNFQHELWRHLQTWSRDPSKAANVWLAYGDRDRLRTAMPLLTRHCCAKTRCCRAQEATTGRCGRRRRARSCSVQMRVQSGRAEFRFPVPAYRREMPDWLS